MCCEADPPAEEEATIIRQDLYLLLCSYTALQVESALSYYTSLRAQIFNTARLYILMKKGAIIRIQIAPLTLPHLL